LKDSTRRRIAGLTAGLLLLLLVSCNVFRAIRAAGDGYSVASPATAALGASPLAPLQPGSGPSQIISPPPPAVAKTAPSSNSASGAPGATGAAASSATTSQGSSPQPEASNPVPSPAPSAAGARPDLARATAQAVGSRVDPFSTIQGSVVSANGTALRGGTVRLRDARFGRIVETQMSDQSGAFAFRTIDPGVYVVEVVGDDQRVLAASQMLTVNAGNTVSTSVRLPERDFTLRNAAIVAAAAAAAGVLTTTATDPVSPTR